MRMSARLLGYVRGWPLELLLLTALYLAGLFLFAATLSRQPGSFNSDDLYCFSICEDWLQGRDMRGWHFTAVPYVFPDLLLLLPCQALFSNLVVIVLAYDFLFYSLLTAVLAWIVRLIGFRWREAFRIAGTGVLFLLAAHLDSTYSSMAGQMYQPGFHAGAILAGLLLMAVVLHGLRYGVSIKTVLPLLTLCPLAVFSDRLLIIQFIVPMLASLCLLAIVRTVPLGRLILLGSFLGMGVLLAGAIRWCFPRIGLILMRMDMGNPWPRWGDVSPFFQQFFADMPNLFLLPLYLLTGLAVVRCWLRGFNIAAEPDRKPAATDSPDRPAVLFVASAATLSPLSNMAAVFLHCSDNPLHWFVPPPSRYLFACWLLPFLFLGLFVPLLPGWWRRHGGACVQGAVMLFAVYQIGRHAAAMNYTLLEPPYPPLARTLDRLQRERGPLRGLAGYWTARRMNFLSRQRVWVRPAFYNGCPWFHAYNPNRFVADNPADLTLPAYNFIVLSSNDETSPRRREVLAEFGEPVEKIGVDSEEVWLYERLSSPRFDRFLEAQLAPRMCRRAKYVAPVSPSTLGIPKPNFLHGWSARNVHLKAGEDLQIRFDHPVCGGLIDVAANFEDEYSLAFYRGEELMGILNVPAVPWTGAVVYYYPPPGIQSRLLRLPESLRNRSWDRVVVKPAASSTERSLGHFLVFEEDAVPATVHQNWK